MYSFAYKRISDIDAWQAVVISLSGTSFVLFRNLLSICMIRWPLRSAKAFHVRRQALHSTSFPSCFMITSNFFTKPTPGPQTINRSSSRSWVACCLAACPTLDGLQELHPGSLPFQCWENSATNPQHAAGNPHGSELSRCACGLQTEMKQLTGRLLGEWICYRA